MELRRQVLEEENMVKKIGIPCEFKLQLVMTAYSTMLKGFVYEIRERFDAATALELLQSFFNRDDRVKNLTNFIKKVFKIEGNDVESISKWFEIWSEITGSENIILETSKTFGRNRIIKCPFKMGYKDLSDWCVNWIAIIYETLNPKATIEAIKLMCAGDPYCEFVSKIEE
jgi:hypothetical protein